MVFATINRQISGMTFATTNRQTSGMTVGGIRRLQTIEVKKN